MCLGIIFMDGEEQRPRNGRWLCYEARISRIMRLGDKGERRWGQCLSNSQSFLDSSRLLAVLSV